MWALYNNVHLRHCEKAQQRSTKSSRASKSVNYSNSITLSLSSSKKISSNNLELTGKQLEIREKQSFRNLRNGYNNELNTDQSIGDSTHEDTSELQEDQESLEENNHNNINRLYNESCDVQFRSQPHVFNIPSTVSSEPKPPLQKMDPLKFMEGLVPFLPYNVQLQMLKEREKMLMIEKWKQTWEEVRPPRTKWYEMADRQFHIEAKKNITMLNNPEYQELEHQARRLIMELYYSKINSPST